MTVASAETHRPEDPATDQGHRADLEVLEGSSGRATGTGTATVVDGHLEAIVTETATEDTVEIEVPEGIETETEIVTMAAEKRRNPRRQRQRQRVARK